MKLLLCLRITIGRFLESALSETLCLACGREVRGSLHTACARTLPWRIDSRFNWVYSCLPYRDSLVKKIILYQKSKRIDRLPKIFAAIIARALLQIATQGNCSRIYLVPIPARPARITEFGFNQALVLANFIAKESSCITVATILKRKPGTNPKQAWAENRQARITSIAGSFVADLGKASRNDRRRWALCSPPQIAQRRRPHPQISHPNKNALYIIIDDVSTTGATLAEAKRALSYLGIKNIIGFTLAH